MLDEILNKINTFVNLVNKIAEDRKKEINKREIDHDFFQTKVEEFNYSLETGLTFRTIGQTVRKKIKSYDLSKIKEDLVNSNEYKQVLEVISKEFQQPDISYRAQNFADRILYAAIDGEKDLSNMVTIFLKELREEPLQSGATVELKGLRLESEIIEINHDAKIRRPIKSDLESESFYLAGIPAPNWPKSNPDAILELEIMAKNTQDIQKTVERAITMLRLFKVGSVKDVQYKMKSESLTGFIGGRIMSNPSQVSMDSYVIRDVDIVSLRKFWKTFIREVSADFFDLGVSSKLGHLAFAYHRYSDALLSNEAIERRLTNAIIGLEAIYSNSNQEIAKHLRLRVAKLLGSFDYDPYRIRKVLADAYDVRSKFVHGNHFGYKEKKRIESRYGSPGKFLLEVLDYLRASIIVLLFLKKEKDEFVDLIDDAFIDVKKDELLRKPVMEIKMRIK